MNKAYDIFKEEDESGGRTFVETVFGLHQMKKRLMKLTAMNLGRYSAYDPTGARFVQPFKELASDSRKANSPMAISG
jgi:hypothetical protein